MRFMVPFVASLLLAPATTYAQAEPPTIINLNDSVEKSQLGPFVSNAGIPNESGLIVIGPDEDANDPDPVDHARITIFGFGIDPIFGCNFANGSAEFLTPVQNRETLCTWTSRRAFLWRPGTNSRRRLA